MRRIYEAKTEAKDIFTMETSTKQVDKAIKLLNEAILIMRKWEAALSAKKIKGKVDGETGIEIDSLIESIKKISDKATSYAVKLSAIKEED